MKALRWREDVDMIANTITVNQQTRNKQITTQMGHTRRTSKDNVGAVIVELQR